MRFTPSRKGSYVKNADTKYQEQRAESMQERKELLKNFYKKVVDKFKKVLYNLDITKRKKMFDKRSLESLQNYHDIWQSICLDKEIADYTEESKCEYCFDVTKNGKNCCQECLETLKELDDQNR